MGNKWATKWGAGRTRGKNVLKCVYTAINLVQFVDLYVYVYGPKRVCSAAPH
ncbi:hypothetical protein LY78DRAFT_664509, partial [Colletotrichum sublineola]